MDTSSDRPLLVEMPIKIKGYEIDVINIVSNIVYVKWFEDLRHLFLDTYYPFEEMIKSEGISPVLRKTQVNYLHHLNIYDQPTGRVWVSSLKGVRWECSFEIVTAQKVHCTGVQGGFFMHVEKQRPVAVPGRLQEAYQMAISI